MHIAPNPSQVHVYRVRAAAGALTSSWATTNQVQLLAPPNKPTTSPLAAYSDKAAALTFAWTHNPVDTSPQQFYEVGYSTNGGSTWNTTGKVASGTSNYAFAANTYAAGVTLTLRVRTWGSATTGGSDGAGASPWSDTIATTFKTRPTATVTSPANGSTYADATLRVNTGFSQSESATYVSSVLQLLQGATLLEEMSTTVQTGATFATQVQNGVSYTVKVKVRDSNGLWSDWASSTFDVAYLPPVPATVTVNYLQDTGFGQVNLLIPAAGAGEAEAATFTITREIAGVVEDVVRDYPVQAEIAILDTTPVVNGANLYRVTTRSALGAEVTVTATLTTAEKRRAFLSKGPGFATVGVFGGNLDVDEDASVAGETVVAAGRAKPIGLYGTETSVKVKVKSFVFEGFGSTLEQLRDLLLIPGQACYRDPSGRRVFGVVDGSISRKRADRGDFSFTLEEAD